MKLSFKVKEVRDRIFSIEFTNQYDMCMMFLRYQEFYESASLRFRGKSFEILDFMKWYSEKYGNGSFTYPKDWSGFNLPSFIISQVWDNKIVDSNLYDYEMREVYKSCRKKVKDDFYIIGVLTNNAALDHEIAHGYFYLHTAYREEMRYLEKQLDPKVRKVIRQHLSKIGYTPKVYVDETQAYLSTSDYFDDSRFFNKQTQKLIRQYQKPFREAFAKYENL
jgi:hypothetical protein